jgi:hypothetical protein
MANYAVSDVAQILREREWSDWDELLHWLEKQPANPQEGLSQRDKDELLRDMRQARDDGQELVREPGELYRAIMSE